ncbi:MAG: 3-phosphoglycerate dehydrogenase [Candidatus Poribacteria bacterium]|nr:MAG: 3-phosphoglycerate dehydrogenase [Candidatus Poribacteria bacterium]
MAPKTLLVRADFYERHRERLKELAPNVRFLTFHDREEMLQKLPEADGLYGASPREDILERATRLRWVHMRSAGVDRYMPRALAERGITLTKGSGAYDIPIAEHVLAMMFAFARGLHRFIRNQIAGVWDRSYRPVQLAGKTLGVYGMGSIGTELARKAHGLGMRVYGIAYHPRPAPGFVEALWTPDRLDDLLEVSDFFAVCVPLTEATRGMFGRREFQRMKRTAYFFNIGRGATVRQDELIEALQAGEIAGAGLDVTDPEPLPPDSPLWKMENVILTPHISGSSDQTEQRADAIVLENIRRFAHDEPLLNVVHPDLGY